MKELTFTQALKFIEMEREYGLGNAMAYLEQLGFETLIWNSFEKQYKQMKEIDSVWLYETARTIQDIQFVTLGIDEVIEQARTYYECLDY